MHALPPLPLHRKLLSFLDDALINGRGTHAAARWPHPAIASR